MDSGKGQIRYLFAPVRRADAHQLHPCRRQDRRPAQSRHDQRPSLRLFPRHHAEFRLCGGAAAVHELCAVPRLAQAPAPPPRGLDREARLHLLSARRPRQQGHRLGQSSCPEVFLCEDGDVNRGFRQFGEQVILPLRNAIRQMFQSGATDPKVARARGKAAAEHLSRIIRSERDRVFESSLADDKKVDGCSSSTRSPRRPPKRTPGFWAACCAGTGISPVRSAGRATTSPICSPVLENSRSSYEPDGKDGPQKTSSLTARSSASAATTPSCRRASPAAARWSSIRAGRACCMCGRGRCLLVRQFRYAYGEETLEIPAGKLDPGEDPARTAARELAEETGWEPASVRHLYTFTPPPATPRKRSTSTAPRACARGAIHPDEDEFLTSAFYRSRRCSP